MSVVETFLVQKDQTKPASVGDGAWAKILQDRQLDVATDAVVLSDGVMKLDGEQGDSVVLLTWAPKQGNDVLLKHDFSSERNSSYFGTAPQLDSDLRNTAYIGDGFKSGVMLLRRSPTAINPSLQKAILPAFGIDLKGHEMLSRLLAVVDATGVLTATPIAAPDWVFTTDNKPAIPLALPAGVNVFTRAPTNGLWCVSQNGFYSVVTAVSYRVSLDLSAIKKWLADNFGGLTPSDWKSSSQSFLSADFTFTQTSVYTTETLGRTQGSIGMYNTVVSVAFHLSTFVLHVALDRSSIRTLLVPSGAGSIWSMINGAFDSNDLAEDSDMLPRSQDSSDSSIFKDVFSHVYLWHISVSKSFASSPNATGASLSWNFGLVASLTLANDQSGGKDKVILTFLYDSAAKTFVGRFLGKKTLTQESLVRAATWDPRIDPTSILIDNSLYDGMVDGIDLLRLVGLDNTELPIPLTLEEAEISFTKGSSGVASVLTIHGVFGQPVKPDSQAPLPFEWTSATVHLVVSKGTTTSYDISMLDTFTITGNAEAGTTPPSAQFSILLAYRKSDTDSQWTIGAFARDVSVSLIRSFFDDGAQDGAMAVLGRLNLAVLDIQYTLVSKKSSSFLMEGVLMLGELELDLSYTYSKETAKETSDWTFKAVLSVGSPGSTIASVAESIVAGASDSLPDFVGSIPINPVASQAGAPVCLVELNSDTDIDKGTSTALTVWLSLGGISLTFIQYKTRAKAPADSHLKRILRISVDQIPLMNKIPLIGQMPQPFDHLIYMWVEDDQSKLTGNAKLDQSRLGFTKSDLDDLKLLLPQDIPPIQVKETSPPKSDSSNAAPDNKAPVTSKASTPADIALAHGHHFVVIVGGKVVLDHVFDTNKSDSQAGGTGTVSGSQDSVNTVGKTEAIHNTDTSGNASPDTNSQVSEARPTKGSTNTSAGPLSISALTLQYKKGHLIVTLDATLKLGPLTFSVIGFALDITLSGVKLDHLADIVTHGLISASLHGMEVGVQQGPLTLKGVFIHDKTAEGESYRGGIAVGFKAWQVLAIGEYFVHFDSKGNEDYKAVFVYGKIDGPLIELEFATISGVRVGFGYNYAIRMPGLQELTSFPLISDSGIQGSGSDPGAVLEAFRGGANPFVNVKKGSVWFAAGMTITAFDLLTLTAVLVLDVDTGQSDPNEQGVIIAMFADGIFQMEPLLPPEASLFYIELVIKIELNFVDGYIAADAALAPASHVYVPMAHLTGQASFYTWFGNNPHAGDWVVSIGGYARGYKPYDWYPVPQRVALNFTVGDNIQMIGQAYCAVTPKCAMAGGSLHLSLSVGPVSAYADLIIDAFINFQPFHFRAEMSISVGVECDIDILFVHIHVSISLGADLVVWGPHDFGGRAQVHFWFFGFNISFGADEDPSVMNPIELPAFLDMVIKPGPGNSPRPDDTVGATGGASTLHKYSVEEGLAPQVAPPADGKGNFPSTGATSHWSVLAGTLRIRIDCGCALSQAFLEQMPGTAAQEILLPSSEPAPDVFSWPMHCTSAQKMTSVLHITIRKAVNNEVVDHFKAELVLKSASKALWSAWDASLDPLHAPSTPDHLNDPADGTVDLVQAVRIMPPDPQRARSKIIDFDATAAMKFTIPNSPSFPALESQPATLQPVYFDGPDAQDKDVDGPTRWADLRAVWTQKNTDANDPSSMLEADVRASLAGLVADTLEWQIRPPEQMAKNSPSAAPATAVPVPGLPAVSVPNAPRINADGMMDWQLLSEPPGKMLGLLETYYQALPYVVA